MTLIARLHKAPTASLELCLRGVRPALLRALDPVGRRRRRGGSRLRQAETPGDTSSGEEPYEEMERDGAKGRFSHSRSLSIDHAERRFREHPHGHGNRHGVLKALFFLQ